MPLERPMHEDDHHGRWLCFHFNQQPAIQVFLASDLTDLPPETVLYQPISVFWLGPTQSTYVFEFMHAIINPTDHQIRVQYIADDGVTVRHFVDGRSPGIQLPRTVGPPPFTGLFSATLETRERSASFADR